MVTGNFKKWR